MVMLQRWFSLRRKAMLGGLFNGVTMVMLRGGQFNGGRMVMLQRWPSLMEGER